MAEDKLKKLIKYTHALYNLKNTKSNIYVNLLRYEMNIYRSLTDDEIITLKDLLLQTEINDNNSLLDDLINYEEKNFIIERINYNINELLNKKYTPINNEFINALHQATKNRYLIINKFELKLRQVFEFFLASHLESSIGMSDDYINKIKSTLLDIKFKYNYNNSVSSNNDITLENYMILNIEQEYLNTLIESTIKEMLKFSNEELENDDNYAKIMIYQTLLRSLFVFVNSYEYLNTFCDFYNELEPNETTAKRIVRSSVISNYEDVKLIRKRKENM